MGVCSASLCACSSFLLDSEFLGLSGWLSDPRIYGLSKNHLAFSGLWRFRARGLLHKGSMSSALCETAKEYRVDSWGLVNMSVLQNPCIPSRLFQVPGRSLSPGDRHGAEASQWCGPRASSAGLAFMELLRKYQPRGMLLGVRHRQPP